MAVATTTADAEIATLSTKEAYAKLITKLETITRLEQCSSVLSYDRAVFMPDNAGPDRGAQLAALAGLLHKEKTNPEIKLLLQQIKEAELADEDEKRLIELEKKAMEENERISPELAARVAALESECYAAWVKARQAKDFPAFAPLLQKGFETAIEVATAKRGDNTDISIYTQMLDQYEVGMPQNRIDEIFNEIQSALVPLTEKVLNSPYQPNSDVLKGEFPIEKQQKLGNSIVETFGYDTTKGRIDVAVHPFTSSMSKNDVRITSRFNTSEWYQGLAGTIHESGHAMYEQNLGKGSATQIDSALSLGTHESQSLFWERHIGLSRSFWKWAFPKLQETFPDQFDSSVTSDAVYEAVNIVRPGFIRVEADELTYPLHVILRYNIEKDVMAGTLKVDDIPTRWNADMKRMLGVDVTDDAVGCLQDIHWSYLAFGYFPTYLLGSATAAQLAYYCAKDIPNLNELIESGTFAPIKEWLTAKVHKHGKRYKSLDSLLQAELGEPLNPKYFIDYLTTKYSEIYKL
jgi:carboxypeptidase Taq